MFNWLKRKAQLAIIRSAEEDIDRFIASLRGADVEDLRMIVAVATHWRHVFSADGIDLLDPVTAEKNKPTLLMTLNRLIREVQKEKPEFAVGLMVWLHTVRAANMPELRYKGRIMWGELSQGFEGAEAAGFTLSIMQGVRLHLSTPDLVPAGLEPDHR